MKIVKKHLDEMYRSYCASSIMMNNELHLLIASEEKGGPCYDYSGKDFTKREEVWNNAGGCMSIVPIPNKAGEFLAVQEFYLKATPSVAKIVWGKYDETKGWIIQDVVSLPYIHRFDIYEKNGVNYFIGATISTTKQHKEDWSDPGKIYVGILPEDLNEGIKLEVLVDGQNHNHGYYRYMSNGEICGYFTSDDGIKKITPPEHLGETWSVERILDGLISEVALIDIDGDGEAELMTIEPFHGNSIKIYKKINHQYEVVYNYPTEIDFAHTLVGATLAGVHSFVGGIRRVNAEMFYVQFIDGQFVTTVVEEGCGPANLSVVNQEDRDLIIAANHTKNEAAVYFVSK